MNLPDQKLSLHDKLHSLIQWGVQGHSQSAAGCAA